jgi:hypothetical protein
LPAIPQIPQPYAGQVNLTSKPPTTQLVFRQMVGEILQWNADVPPTEAKRWLNFNYRRIVDKRVWYGLMIHGQCVVPNVYTTGTASVTLGSPTATLLNGGIVSPNFVGYQFRVGFTSMFYTIIGINQVANTLTLELPWGNPSQSSVGYQICNNLVTLGPNIKFIHNMLNQRQGYQLFVNMPVDIINRFDTWRTTQGWTFMLCNREPSAAGWPQFELFPTPTFQQAFPYWAYIQPPDMVLDDDYPVTMFPSDVIVARTISDALLFRGPKLNKYYDPVAAKYHMGVYTDRLMDLERVDDNLFPRDLMWDYSRYPFSRHGSLWLQSHASNFPNEEL